MADKQTMVKVQNLTKTFKTPIEASTGIKQKLINILKGRKGYREFTPLKDVSFEVKKGDFFGIVGRNGSGKSTLLKTIAGIYAPNEGLVQVNGTLVPFIELGVGFNPELTGRENVYLNGALLGFSNSEVDEMYDDIVDFAELHDFMDERLKNYSSGMQVRLAFSIAIKAEGDVLLLDEVLAVGDEAFQRKCYTYFAELKKNKKTVILVTHDMSAVQQFCNRAMVIKNGKAVYVGSAAKASLMYREDNTPSDEIAKRKNRKTIENSRVEVGAELINRSTDKTLEFNISVTPKEDIDSAVAAISITKETGEIVYRWASNEKLSSELPISKNKKMIFRVKIQNIFPDGKFSLNLSLRNRDMTEFYVSVNELVKFEIVNTSSYPADSYWKPKEEVRVLYDK